MSSCRAHDIRADINCTECDALFWWATDCSTINWLPLRLPWLMSLITTASQAINLPDLAFCCPLVSPTRQQRRQRHRR